ARGLRLVQAVAGAAPKTSPSPPTSTTDPLVAAVTTIKGVGPALAQSMAERGIRTIEDLLWLLPRRYDDARSLLPLDDALAGVQAGDRVAARVRVMGVRMIRARGRRWAELRAGDPRGGPVRLVVRWFN